MSQTWKLGMGRPGTKQTRWLYLRIILSVISPTQHQLYTHMTLQKVWPLIKSLSHILLNINWQPYAMNYSRLGWPSKLQYKCVGNQHGMVLVRKLTRPVHGRFLANGLILCMWGFDLKHRNRYMYQTELTSLLVKAVSTSSDCHCVDDL